MFSNHVARNQGALDEVNIVQRVQQAAPRPEFEPRRFRDRRCAYVAGRVRGALALGAVTRAVLEARPQRFRGKPPKSITLSTLTGRGVPLDPRLWARKKRF